MDSSTSNPKSGTSGTGDSGSTSPGSATSGQGRRVAGGDTPAKLSTERGVTSIADSVVAKITSLAAKEVRGVADLGGTVSGALGGVVGRIRGQEHATTGVGVEVGEAQAAVDISLRAEYPASIHQVADAVRQNVIDRIETMTGLEVVEVNIAVVDLVFPGGEEGEQPQETRVQ